MLRTLWRAAAIAIALLGPGTARADGSGPCSEGEPRVADLGIDQLECNCTFSASSHDHDVHRAWRFRSEPRIVDLEHDGPAREVLRVGDVITSIDGRLITTSEGGRRFANLRAGEPVVLMIRRDGRIHTVRVVPEEVCLSASLGGTALTPQAPMVPATPPAPAVAPTPGTPAPPVAEPAPRAFRWEGSGPAPAGTRAAPRAATAPRVVVTPRPDGPPALVPFVPETLPRGWIGVGLSCRSCGGEISEGSAEPVWSFGSLPLIDQVEPGSPAARSGLRRGDVLTHIDGVSLLTDDGGRRFATLRPGQRVVWTVRRGGQTHAIPVVAEPRPGAREITLAQLADRLRELRLQGDHDGFQRDWEAFQRSFEAFQRRAGTPADKRLRYAGEVGGSDVEVRGLGNVVVDDSGDEIVITTPDATIRIRPSATVPPKGVEAERPKRRR
jgi:membrane-associated protease RseP (regulator of RpoE activity)